MNRIFMVIGLVIVGLIWFFYPQSERANKIRIGIVLPIQHQALDDIVHGFSDVIEAQLGKDNVEIEVQNALGDINLQKSAIGKFLQYKVDLLVPVATGSAQMAINLSPKDQPLLFLAADIAPTSTIAQNRPNLMGVIDELGVKRQLDFMTEALPELKKVAIIYSANDKFPKEAQEFSEAAGKNGLVVQKMMIQTLAELYTVASRIEADVQAIFILKDNLVVSGISALVQQANKMKIPLITSDEATNALGSAFALGVIESDIGRQGAHMALAFLQKRENPGIKYLDAVSVFINSEACNKQGVMIESVEKAASQQHYAVRKR